jgi:hypothetical protein
MRDQSGRERGALVTNLIRAINLHFHFLRWRIAESSELDGIAGNEDALSSFRKSSCQVLRKIHSRKVEGFVFSGREPLSQRSCWISASVRGMGL